MEINCDFDIAVVGGGPAGATLARLIGKKYSTVLLNRELPSGKPCGGLLSSDALSALARFDLTLPRSILCDPQIFSVRTTDLSSGLTRRYRRFYLNLDRAAFDRWLLSLLPGEVARLSGVCTGVSRIPGGFELTCKTREGVKRITARRVVGADGASSVVRRSLFPKASCRSYTAIQQSFPLKSSQPFYSCVFDPATSDCCSWMICKDDRLIFGGAFPRKHPRAAFEAQKEKLSRRFGLELSQPLHTEACRVLRPKSPLQFCCGADGAFLIGEAAGFISPSSLEGISWAFSSAVALSSALGKRNENAAYKKSTLRLRIKLTAKMLKSPFMYRPLLRRLVMRSGLTAISPLEQEP